MLRLSGRSVLVVMLLLVPAAWGAEVGTIAAVDGTAQVGRDGAWKDASTGMPVQRGDELRTGRPGHLRVVFQDDSVLTLAEDSRVLVDEQVFDPERGRIRSLMQLVRGRVDALVSEYYHGAGTVYEMRTKTAVAGVRGTDFIMRYDPIGDLTEVVGVSGRVQVQSLLARGGPAVFVTAGEMSSVVEGRAPTPPQRLEEKVFRQRLEGIEFIGTGSVGIGHSLMSGASVPQPDRAATVFTSAAAGGVTDERVHNMRDLSTVLQQPPVELGGRLHFRIF